MRTFTICFVGRSGSGKTTLAQALEKRLTERNVKVDVLDGDVIRSQLGNMFGYTRSERIKQSRVNVVLAQYLNRHQINVIMSMVGAYEEMRSGLREYLGSSYIEVYVKCSCEECARRDVKGYYKQCREGKLENLNGANDAYEEPQNSEIVVNTESENQEECMHRIIHFLESNDYI